MSGPLDMDGDLKTHAKIDDTIEAVPRMGRQSRCTYPFWVFASKFLLFFCVLYYKFILYIIRGVPNKAVEKKKIPKKALYGITQNEVNEE